MTPDYHATRMIEFLDDTLLRRDGSPIAGTYFNRRSVVALFWPDGTIDEDCLTRGRFVLRRLVYSSANRQIGTEKSVVTLSLNVFGTRLQTLDAGSQDPHRQLCHCVLRGAYRSFLYLQLRSYPGPGDAQLPPMATGDLHFPPRDRPAVPHHLQHARPVDVRV